jgi:acetylornithine deacetylase/succinyl-diaminopimelate desuccinylase family protein
MRPDRLLAELIAIPSVNPAFGCEKGEFLGELRVAEFLAGRAVSAGLPVEFHEVLPQRPNLLTRLSPTGKVRRRVLLAPHLDTIGLPGAWTNLFRPVRRRGRLYGRGSCDTKGSVAAMFTALLRLADSGRRPEQTEITFAGLIDEESAQAGSRALVSKGLRADLAVVGEPTCLKVVTAHKGDLWFSLDTRGKAAHGSRPELGRNAVHEMARIVDVLETEYAARLKERRHPVLGHATINVGSISGGAQPNVVPARCQITIDRRTLPGENERTVRKEIGTLLRAHDLRATLVNIRKASCVPLDTDAKLPLVRHFLDTAGQAEPAGVDFFCDAAVLGEAGIPSVVFGPGDIAQAHTADEWISLSSLERTTDLLERFLRSLP